MRIDLSGIWLSLLPIKEEEGYGVQVLLDNRNFFYQRHSKRLFTESEMEGLTKLCEKPYTELCEVLPTLQFAEPDIGFIVDEYKDLFLRFYLWEQTGQLSPHSIDCVISQYELEEIVAQCQEISKGHVQAEENDVRLQREQKFPLSPKNKLFYRFTFEDGIAKTGYDWPHISLEVQSKEFCFQEIDQESMLWDEVFLLHKELQDFLQGKANFGKENSCIEPEYVYYFYNNPPSMDWRYKVYDDEGAACSSYLNLHLDREKVQALFAQIEQFLSREDIHVRFMYILTNREIYKSYP